MGTSFSHTWKKGMAALLLAAMPVVLASIATAQPTSPNSSARAKKIVLVSIPDRKLAVLEDGQVLATFRVAVGASISPSPRGEFAIVNRLANPTYYHDGIVIPPGQGNPVGTRWLGLNLKGYGIHGTNTPRSAGRAASHGCIRLRNHDVERLYTMLQVGDIVEIRGERDEQTEEVFGKPARPVMVSAGMQMAVQAGGQ